MPSSGSDSTRDRPRPKVVVAAGGDGPVLCDALLEAGLDCTCTDPGLLDGAAYADAALVVVDLRDDAPVSILEDAKRGSVDRLTHPVLALVDNQETAVAQAFDAGASDVVRSPVRTGELCARVTRLLAEARAFADLQRRERHAEVVLTVTRALASSLDFHEILFTVVRRIAEEVSVDRVSAVLSPQGDENVGYVIAASDDEQISNLRLDLGKYPEIRQVLRTGVSLTIDDVALHPVFDGVRADVASARVRSIMLLPIMWEAKAIGVLSLRMKDRPASLSRGELDFCQAVADAMAAALRNARAVQSLRDHTQQETFARFEAERRLASLRRYADLFASSADGIVVADPKGHLLFANPRAYDITGFPEGTLDGRHLLSLVDSPDRARAQGIWLAVTPGAPLHNVDLRIAHRDGTVIVCSLSLAVLRDEDGAVLVSFRDVTEQRRIESELVHTKEFLESLIDASVDGIVAADTSGTVVLFNSGAERIYGYKAADVIGKLHVRELYPDDGAREIMAMIRAPQHGGPGRLESVRIDARGASGELIPISISAAMVYQDRKPVATFGIFTDLREKIRAEQRLAQAQEKLALSERQALIAELAGTAAHELNQPLTSVMGYAELLKRKTQRESPEHRAADIIVREAERMADIVRKIGKITRYETKSYVGEQRILDLDRAVTTETPAPKGGEK